MLLLPFVENAFKHGVQVNPEDAFVEFTVVADEHGTVSVRVVNSKEPMDEQGLEEPGETVGGVGLDNLQRRLLLLYPERHHLSLHDAGDDGWRYVVNPIRCLIVDDEPLAWRVIENFAKHLSFLQIVRKCRNALEARTALHEEEGIDLIFLDIEMPRLSGLSFLRSLKHPPLVVFTTAYEDHALESYELEAVDYLKKPFSFERFSQAVEKVQRRLAPIESQVEQPKKDATSETFFVKSGHATVRVNVEEIVLLEGMGDYVKIWCHDRSIVSNQTLQQWESRLPSQEYARVHRSFIVAVPKIDQIEGDQIVILRRRVPIGRAYRKALMARIGEF